MSKRELTKEEKYNKVKRLVEKGFCMIKCNQETFDRIEKEFGWNPTIAWEIIPREELLKIKEV